MPQYIERKTHETVAAYLQRFAVYHRVHLSIAQVQNYCTHYQLIASTPVSQLTSLQARILALALAVVHDPRLVLLDGPLAGLTEQDQAEFWPYLQRTLREGRTLLSTFTLPLAENLLSEYDLIVRLEQGEMLREQE
jgi:ABC-type multidrug transport system ATPase subunit